MPYELLSRSAHDTGLDDESVQCIVTSPPYWGLRKYDGEQGVEWPGAQYSPMSGLPNLHISRMICELGLEPTISAYVAHIVLVFREMRRVLKDDGVAWLNMGDSYASRTKGSGGSGKSTLGPNKDLQNIQFQKYESRNYNHGLKDKDLCGIPWRVVFALQADGWYLRSDVIWSKANPMPESIRDRPTRAHEYVFLLAKSKRYYYDADAVKESSVDAASTRNRRTVWHMATQPYKGAHFATWPQKLVEPMILAGSRPGETVLDPFSGSGTSGVVALEHGRNYIGIDISDEYNRELAEERLREVQMRLI